MQIKLNIPAKIVEFERSKKKWIVGSILYRLNKILNTLFHEKYVLKFTLDLALIFWRIAYENSYRYYGQEYKNITYGIDENLLKKYTNSESTIIDIGCGYGRLTKVFSKHVKKVIGIDYSQNCIEYAKKNNFESNIEYYCNDLNNFKFTEKYDIAIMSGVLEHIDDAQKYLFELHNVAKILIIEVPDFDADPLNIARYNINTRLYSDDDHVREYTENALVNQLFMANWQVIEIRKKGMQITIIAKENESFKT